MKSLFGIIERVSNRRRMKPVSIQFHNPISQQVQHYFFFDVKFMVMHHKWILQAYE